MSLPNFIIVGAAKAGTRALIDYLDQHNEIYTYPDEIHFFSKNYNKGIDWYQKFFKNVNDEKAIGEKSPSYFTSSKTPERIFQNIPDVKLIFLLRNPVDRAYSHYWHAVRGGRIKNGFEEKIKNEGNNILETGKYAKYINKYLKFFKKEASSQNK